MSDSEKPAPARSRATPLRVAVFAASGLLLCAVAVWALRGIFFAPDMSQMSRVRAAAAAGALVVGGATFECIRRTQLRERYALLWIFPCLAILVLAFFPSLPDAIRFRFGLSYGSVFAAVAFLSLVFAMFVFSLALSRLESKLARCAQYAALLEARLRESEMRGGSGGL